MTDAPAQEPDDSSPAVYAVRISVQAEQDVVEAMLRLAELTQEPAAARNWKDGLYQQLATLATHPRRLPIATQETRRFGRETRQMLYRRTRDSAAYRIFFSIAEDVVDGPTVRIIHVRHASRRPLTREEARRVIGNQ